MSKEIDVIQTNEEKTWLETIADKLKLEYAKVGAN